MLVDAEMLLRLGLLAADERPGGPAQMIQMWAPLVMIMVVWYLIIIRPQTKERREREAMLRELKKNDNVIAAGGIVATVANISADGKEVTLKVDDSTRIRVLRSSIQTVIREPETSS